MRILLLTHAFNSLTQRLFVELVEAGHEVSVEFDVHDALTGEAIELFRPDVIVAPYLKRAIPESIWRRYLCLIVHPGIRGDRGPSALDWAILNDEPRWGVTVLQANAEMDAGDIWASVEFPMREASKSSLYRHEVTEAAVAAVRLSLQRLEQGGFRPEPLDDGNDEVRGRARPAVKQHDRAIDWRRDGAAEIVRRINSADGYPGVKQRLLGRDMYLFDARMAGDIPASPGEVAARSGPAVCVGCVDGAVWIGHARDDAGPHPFKLPATHLLGEAVSQLPEIACADGYREIWYEERAEVGYLHFSFYNGAMGTDQCERMLAAYREATRRPTKVVVLMGGPEFWSNGMHLNLIEAAASPADESWRNINAIDDLSEAIISTGSHLVVSAMQGNAGAGGVFLARASDQLWLRDGVVLNPHYKDMGNLYGSEYWTYLLPRHTGEAQAERISRARLPMGARQALGLGLANRLFDADREAFVESVRRAAEELAASERFDALLDAKRRQRAADEAHKPLARYRREELERMWRNFYGFDPSYHIARYNFVYKVCKSRTPVTLASHRDRGKDRFAGRAA